MPAIPQNRMLPKLAELVAGVSQANADDPDIVEMIARGWVVDGDAGLVATAEGIAVVRQLGMTP